MKETTLLKIALICSLAGLVALYFISIKIDIKEYKPNFLSNKNIGDDVKLTGTITKITQKDNAVFIEIKKEIPVNVVVFTNENMALKENNQVEIFGKVQEYNGKEEIIAEKIRVTK